MSINPDKLNELLGKAVVDFGATFHAALVRVGDKPVYTRPSPPAELELPENWPSVTGDGRALCTRMALQPGGRRVYHL